MSSIEVRARDHLSSLYREYLRHSTDAHSSPFQDVRDREAVQARQSRWEAMSCYWVITGKSAWPRFDTPSAPGIREV